MSASTVKQEMFESKKVKKKISKAQIQLALIKKKECNAKALAIVEQLLEPNVNAEWLLNNLPYINSSHMEDVIEERAIIKLCGYVLCNKTLTIVITQQYHISTKKNKVYDVTRRKNFCSSRCYGACNYLLEQMFTSPLWLRDQEEIRTFKFLSEKDELERSVPGEEIHVGDIDGILNTDSKDDQVETNTTHQNKEDTSYEELSKSHIQEKSQSNENQAESQQVKEDVNNTLEKLITDVQNICLVNSDNINSRVEQDLHHDNTIKLAPLSESNMPLENVESSGINKLSNIDSSECHETSQTECGTTITEENADVTLKHERDTQNIVKSNPSKPKKNKQKNNIKSRQSSEFCTLVMHIENSVKEWFTEDTICLLSGQENAKNRLLENVTQQEKFVQVCKKLNKLQLEDGKEEREDLGKTSLKPLPHLSVLQEEGKKMELKVRAFYTGKMVIPPPENTITDSQQDDSPTILPLTDAHAPKALRRRIFLDKLNKILPDLLRALAVSNQSQYIYNNERNALIKALVNTFSLSATNIIFKTAEWTLVGLIIIKMLSVIDPQLKLLLATRQASMYISMILMSYKLDSNYLHRLVIELTNNPKIFSMHCDTNL